MPWAEITAVSYSRVARWTFKTNDIGYILLQRQNSWFATTWQGGHVFSTIEFFFPQRKEMLLFLTTNMAAVTSRAKPLDHRWDTELATRAHWRLRLEIRHLPLSSARARACLRINWIQTIMVQFCFSRLYLDIRLTLFPFVCSNGWQRWTRIETWKSWANFFKFKCNACKNHQG